MGTAKSRDRNIWGIWNVMLPTSPRSKLQRKNKKHIHSAKNLTQNLIEADDCET